MRLAVLLLTLVLLCPVSSVQGQRLRIAVSVTDSEKTGIFQSNFAAAFRALGDVDVVSFGEASDYVLSGVVLCEDDDCSSTNRYSVALRLYETVEPETANFIAAYALHPDSWEPTPASDSLAAFVWRQMEGLERTHQEWVASWGRNIYERAIREFVARIDAECLEKVRTRRRMLGPQADGSASEQFARYQDFLNSREWLC